jgi:hypothetical protein
MPKLSSLTHGSKAMTVDCIYGKALGTNTATRLHAVFWRVKGWLGFAVQDRSSLKEKRREESGDPWKGAQKDGTSCDPLISGTNEDRKSHWVTCRRLGRAGIIVLQ